MKLGDRQAEFESRAHWRTEMSLPDSLRVGDCLICSNLVQAEQRSIHSFFWEGMMSPDRPAKRIEDERWPAGGIGVAILCENLVAKARAERAIQVLTGLERQFPLHRTGVEGGKTHGTRER